MSNNKAGEHTQGETEIQIIMRLISDSAELANKAQKLGNEYTIKYSPYKAGQFIKFKPKYHPERLGRIERVGFYENSTIKGFARICVKPWRNNLKCPIHSMYPFDLSEASEVIEILSESAIKSAKGE